MKLRRITAALLALVMTVLMLPFDIPAEAAVTKIFGYTLSSNTEKLCFYADKLDLGEYLADREAQGITGGDFGDCYIVPGDTEFDIAEIAGKFPKLKKLKELEVSTRTERIDLSPLKKLTGLEKLTLGQGGKDISVIGGLTNLKDLFLHNYEYNRYIGISNIKKAVSRLTGLESLSFLDCGKFGDLDFLSKHKGLKELYFFDGAVSDLSGIKKLKKLESLDISYNNFHFDGKLDLSPLKNMKAMKVLNLSSSPVKDIEVLKNMKRLEWLGLSGTEVSDMSPIMGLDKLKRLVIYECGDIETLLKFRKKYPDCEIVPDIDEDLYY